MLYLYEKRRKIKVDEEKFNRLVEKMVDEIPTAVIPQGNLEPLFDEIFTYSLRHLKMSEFVEYDEDPEDPYLYYSVVIQKNDNQLTGIEFVGEKYDKKYVGKPVSVPIFAIDISPETLHRAEEAIKKRKDNYHNEIMVNNFSELFEKLNVTTFENIARNYFCQKYGNDLKYNLRGYGDIICKNKEFGDFLAELGASITERDSEHVIIRTKHEAYRVCYADSDLYDDVDYVLFFSYIERDIKVIDAPVEEVKIR